MRSSKYMVNKNGKKKSLSTTKIGMAWGTDHTW
jgi:hypothetical protein